LSDHDYTFSPHTRYEGPTLLDDTIFVGLWVYELSFFNVINGSRVRGNGVSLKLSIETGEVLKFYYYWHHVPSLPVGNIITAEEAMDNTLDFFVNEKNVLRLGIGKAQLWFYPLSVYPIHEYWLCWVVELRHDRYGEALVNAIDGRVLEYSERMI
jgi:hypothetical protein